MEGKRKREGGLCRPSTMPLCSIFLISFNNCDPYSAGSLKNIPGKIFWTDRHSVPSLSFLFTRFSLGPVTGLVHGFILPMSGLCHHGLCPSAFQPFNNFGRGKTVSPDVLSKRSSKRLRAFCVSLKSLSISFCVTGP